MTGKLAGAGAWPKFFSLIATGSSQTPAMAPRRAWRLLRSMWRCVRMPQPGRRRLNAHVHFHCCVIDGVFAAGADGQVHFTEAGALTHEDLSAVQQQVRARVLRWFARAGHLDPTDARNGRLQSLAAFG